MTEISILSFLSFFVLSALGAYWHYRKMRKTGRHNGTLFDYLFADYPGKSAAVWMALLGSSWAMATTGTADFINPELVWATLLAGKLHVPSIGVAALAVQSGYAFDSMLNKGAGSV